MRRARLAAEGELGNGTSHFDVVLLWSGGACEVDVRCDGRDIHARRFSAGLDLLPVGTQIECAAWKGAKPCECIEVALPSRLGPVLRADGMQLGVADAHLADMVERLAHQAESGLPLGEAYVDGLTLTLAAYLRARHGGLEPTRSPARDAGPLLSARQRDMLRAYIEEHLTDGMDLSALAALVPCGVRHLLRLFKGSFGMSPHQYLLERRIQRAKGLLRDPVQPIAEVALACGFATQAHFHSTFKMRTGVTPGAYRRST